MANQESKATLPQQPKKRRRTTGTTSRKKKATAFATTTTTTESIQQTTPPPTSVLIIDNGGHTIKFGWAEDETNNNNSSNNNNSNKKDSSPSTMPNVTARLQHQWTVLVGDEITRVQNPNSLIGVTRSTERGVIVNLGNQTQVWKRLLDQLGVIIPTNSEAAQALGWGKVASRGSAANQPKNKPTRQIPAHTVAVLLLLPPHCPRVLLDQIINIWMEDFGVSHFGLGISAVSATKEHSSLNCSCVVDLGWSASHIVPTYRRRPFLPASIRRVPIGGRHLINMLKYYMSYRQWNMMDQEGILRDVFEKLAYLSLDFESELGKARQLPSGRRPYDRDYALPDYQTTFQGQVRIPMALRRLRELQQQQQQQKQKLQEGKATNKSAEDDENDHENDNSNDDMNDGNEQNGDAKEGNDSENNDDSDAEETVEEMRRRALKQRAEEERRRREQEEEQQSLLVSVERFTVPEVLFRPFDAGLLPELAGLPHAIAQSIQACPKHYHAALYQSIHVTGGLSQLPNLKTRLERELRSLVPCEYKLQVQVAESPMHQAWLGGREMVRRTPYSQWSVSRDEWVAASKRKSYNRLLVSNGGFYV